MQKVTKKYVHYKRSDDSGKTCGNCIMFHPGDNSCDLVKGDIKASFVCDKWEPESRSANKLIPVAGLSKGSIKRDIPTYSVAFDVDGCLRNSAVDQNAKPVPNEDIRSLLITLSRFENVLIHVWSGAGEYYAREISSHFGIAAYVDSYSSKTEKVAAASPDVTGNDGFLADIAVDDVLTAQLAKINLICGASKSFALPGSAHNTFIPDSQPPADTRGKAPKMVTIAFDIDGTLIYPLADSSDDPRPREDIRSMLIFLSRFRNILIHVWSGGGIDYARDVCASIGIKDYVDSYSAKTEKIVNGELVQGTKGFVADVAVDDLLNSKLGKINLITHSG